MAYEYVDLEASPEERSTVERYNDGKMIIPTIVFPDGSHVAEPSNEELAEKLGLTRDAAASSYDVVIVGGGPAGLTTAIYAARENLRTLVLDRSALGGQAGVTERLDNYPGFPDGIGGADLAGRFVAQGQRYGVEMLSAVSVVGLDPVDGRCTVGHAGPVPAGILSPLGWLHDISRLTAAHESQAAWHPERAGGV